MLLVPTSIFIVNNSEDSRWLIASLVLLGLITLRTAFLWTAKPLIIIEEVLATYFRILDFFVGKSTELTGRAENRKRNLENTAKLVESMTQSLNWTKRFIERNTDQRIVVKLFLVVFGTCFMLTVLIFAIVYYNLTKINPQAFGTPTDWGLLDFLYQSLLVITTSGNINPVGSLAKVAVCVEILAGIGLLSLLVFQFSMISIPEVMNKRVEILEQIDAKVKEILDKGDDYRNRVSGQGGTIDITAESG